MPGIDYQSILATIKQSYPEGERFDPLVDQLVDFWDEAYKEMIDYESDLIVFDFNSSTIVFDQQTALETTDMPLSRLGRNVVVFGVSTSEAKRRRSGFLSGVKMTRTETSDNGTKEVHLDRGHFLAHSMGGGSEVNIYPQRREVNRGWSDRGKVYRRMERFAAKNPGTFVFSRPIYTDDTWIPIEVEYGVLVSVDEFWVDRFEN